MVLLEKGAGWPLKCKIPAVDGLRTGLEHPGRPDAGGRILDGRFLAGNAGLAMFRW